MKGLVFTEFLEMVEERFGFETMERIIYEADLPSGGAYTSVGTYDYGEMVSLLTHLSEKTKVSIPDLLYAYGLYLFSTFERNYPTFLESATSAFDFLESIEKYIHVEVRKLYPDAELPSFSSNRPNDTTLELMYMSERKMGHFALGLIEKSLEYYNEKASVAMIPYSEDGTRVKFVIEKRN